MGSSAQNPWSESTRLRPYSVREPDAQAPRRNKSTLCAALGATEELEPGNRVRIPMCATDRAILVC